MARTAVEELIAGSHAERAEPPPPVLAVEAMPPTPAAVERIEPPATAPASPRTAPRSRPPPRTLGKGGPEHKYLQSLIKNYAESKGFRATIEAPVDGGGSIDVLMERGATKIACEISVTTEPDHESANVRKCLGSGVTQVVVVSPSAPSLKRIEAAVRGCCTKEEASRVTFVSSTDIVGFLDAQGPAQPETATVRGYKVKTTMEGADGGSRKSTVGRTIAQALRRMRGK